MSFAWSQAVCRRVGGGFGGKATRNLPVAVAAAVAAAKTGRPVRLEQSRWAPRAPGLPGGQVCTVSTRTSEVLVQKQASFCGRFKSHQRAPEAEERRRHPRYPPCRATDMRLSAGRCEVLAEYDVGFTSEGTIQVGHPLGQKYALPWRRSPRLGPGFF